MNNLTGTDTVIKIEFASQALKAEQAAAKLESNKKYIELRKVKFKCNYLKSERDKNINFAIKFQAVKKSAAEKKKADLKRDRVIF